MIEPRLCVILPTVGRETLPDAVESLGAAGADERDALVLGVDGADDVDDALVLASLCAKPIGVHPEVLTNPGRPCDVGGSMRNRAIEHALRHFAGPEHGDWYFAFLDDDDTFAPGAFDVIRAALVEEPRIPHMFRMQGPPHGTLWRFPKLELGNVGGPMFVCPAIPHKLGTWDGERCQDIRFIEQTCRLHDDQLAWHEDVIYRVRPHEWATKYPVGLAVLNA